MPSAVMHSVASSETVARIGPNALIQTVKVLREGGDAVRVLERAGRLDLLDEVPEHMVDEREFATLVRVMVDEVGVVQTRNYLHRSGELTAAYLLKHRIPVSFQHLLTFRLVPRRTALRLLLFAISKHAWTFVGSGTFTYKVGQPSQLMVESAIHPTDAVSGFYGGTFEFLIHTLVDAGAEMHTSTSSARCTYIFQ